MRVGDGPAAVTPALLKEGPMWSECHCRADADGKATTQKGKSEDLPGFEWVALRE